MRWVIDLIKGLAPDSFERFGLGRSALWHPAARQQLIQRLLRAILLRPVPGWKGGHELDRNLKPRRLIALNDEESMRCLVEASAALTASKLYWRGSARFPSRS